MHRMFKYGRRCKEDGKVSGEEDSGKSGALNVWDGIRCNGGDVGKILSGLKH